MPPLGLRLATLALALGLLACGNDSVAPATDTVAGSYTATTFTITSTTPPTDALAAGAALILTLAPNGTTSGRLFIPGANDGGDIDEDLTGTWSLSGRSVTFNQSANTFIRDAVFRVGANTLTTGGTFGDTTLQLVLTKPA